MQLEQETYSFDVLYLETEDAQFVRHHQVVANDRDQAIKIARDDLGKVVYFVSVQRHWPDMNPNDD